MSSTCPGNIEIGGTLPKARLKDFLRELRGAGGWDYGTYFRGTKLEDLEELRTASGTLRVCNDSAPGGRFEELEGFCQEVGLSYDSHADSILGDSAQSVFWRPGLDEELTMVSDDSDEDTLVDASAVFKARQTLAEGNIHGALKQLDTLLGDFGKVMQQPLTPFKVE